MTAMSSGGRTMPEITVEPTTYTVSAVPEDVPQAYLWAITVEKRGRGRWAVCRMRECVGTDGEWDWEASPSSRTDEWLESHRFDLATALGLAQREATEVTVNGITVADVLARRASRAATS